MQKQTELANQLWPLLLPRILRLVAGAAGSSGSAGAVGEHELGGGLHKGTLRDDQAPQFLKLDGSRTLTGSLPVAAGVTIDGVDISAHAANPDAHHARQHVLANATALGPDHTISGAVAGHVLKATASNAARMAQLMIPELGATGASWDVAALTAANTVGLRTPSSDVRTAPMEALLKSGAAGELALSFLAVGGAMTLNGNGNTANIPDIQFTGNAILAVENSLYLALDSDNSGAGAAFIIGHNSAVTPLSELFRFDDAGEFRITATAPTISTAANDLTIDPASRTLFADDKQIRSQTHTAGFLGAGFSLSWPLSGKAHLDIRSIYAEELEVTAFQADIMRLRIAEDFLTQSMGHTSRAFTTPSAINGTVRVYFENNAAFDGQIFLPNEWVMFQIIERGAGLLVDRIWGQVSSFIDESDEEQSWLFTLREGPTSKRVNKSTIAMSFGVSGSGYIHHSVLRSMNGPWTRYATWSGANPYTPANRRVHAQAGNLNGLVDISTDRFGIAAGNNLGLTPTTGFSGFLADDTAGMRLFNTAIRIYNGGINTGLWNSDGQFHIGFNGISTANERDFTITTNALRIGRRLTNYPNLLYSQASGYLAFCSGTVDKIRFDDNGDSYFAGVMTIGENGEIRQGTGVLGTNFTGLRIWRDTATGRGLIAGYNANVVQWSADTDGKMRAGGGTVELGAGGVVIVSGPTLTGQVLTGENRLTFRSYLNSAHLNGWIGAADIGASDKYLDVRSYGVNNQNLLLAAETTVAGKTASVQISATNQAGTVSSIFVNPGGVSVFSGGAVAFRNPSGSAFQALQALQITLSNGFVTSDAAVQFWNTPGTALQQIRAGSLMASNTGSHFSRVPASGIYSLGAVGIGVTAVPAAGVMLDVAGQTYMRAAMTLDGALYIKAQPAAPSSVTGYGALWVDSSDSNKLKLTKNGTTYTIAG